jgi:hypothetical protein
MKLHRGDQVKELRGVAEITAHVDLALTVHLEAVQISKGSVYGTKSQSVLLIWNPLKQIKHRKYYT